MVKRVLLEAWLVVSVPFVLVGLALWLREKANGKCRLGDEDLYRACAGVCSVLAIVTLVVVICVAVTPLVVAEAYALETLLRQIKP